MQRSVKNLSTHSHLLYFNPITERLIQGIENRVHQKNIYVLLSKPNHDIQSRKREIQDIDMMFKELEKHQENSAVSIFVLGAPACGKTQLARQYGDWLFKQQAEKLNLKERAKNRVCIVAALDLRNESSLWRSYSRLAVDMGCSVPMDQVSLKTD